MTAMREAHESGSLGKCEMWYILHADPGAEFLLGLKPNTTREMLRAACERGASKELFHRFRPKSGRSAFLSRPEPRTLSGRDWCCLRPRKLRHHLPAG